MIDPITRREKYLAKMAGSNIVTPKPITREEMFLAKAAESAGSGGVSSWNDLTDKPFGEEKAFEPIVWDGSTDGLETFNMFIRIADYIPIQDSNDIEAVHMKVNMDGETMEDTIKAPTTVAEHGWYIAESIVASDGELTNNLGTFPSGVWSFDFSTQGVEVIELSILPATTIKPVDPKYLGGWEAMGSKYENGVIFSGSDFPLVPYTVSDGLNINMFLISERFTLTEGKEYTVNWNGTDYTCVCERMQLGGATGNSVGNIAALTGAGNTGEPFVLGVFDEAFVVQGIKYPAAAVPLDGSTTLTLSITGEIEHITPVPPKYLPGGFGSVVEEGAVLAECSPALVDSSDGMNMFAFTEAFPLVEGHVYTVVWKGNEYTCVCSHMNIGVTGLGLGNIDLLTGNGHTGEPFVLGVFDDPEAMGFPAMAVALDGSEEVTVSVTGTIRETITPLPKKYLPDLGAGVVVVFIDTEFTQIGSSGTSYSISHTNDEIAEAHKKGNFVVLMTGSKNSATNSRDFYMPSSITSSQARFTRIDFYTKSILEVIIHNDNATKQSYSLTVT